MAEALHDDFLQYYKRELSYLREQGADFASRYPKVAARLALQGSESLDPHTERLIEAVAFLTARVHRDLDNEFPLIAAALLDNLCPSLLQPVPSMTVAQFALDPAQGKVMAGYPVPRHTVLYTATSTGEQCRFRTAWNTVLWPLRVSAVEMGVDSTLRLTLECDPGTDLAELELESLRLHLSGDAMVTMPLYEILVSGVVGASVEREDGTVVPLAPDAWAEAGYAEGEEVLPLPPHAQPAYVLMQEYFAFPRKFHFFTLSGLKNKLGSGRTVRVALRLDRGAPVLRRLTVDNFALGCVPLVNLFPRTSEPIVVDHRHYEYLLTADRHRGVTTEVHTILSVTASDPNAERPVVVPSFSALGHIHADGETVFWTARREHSLRQNVAGTDVFLTFVDQTNAMKTPSEPVVYANLLCTNRKLAEQVPVGARMVIEGGSQSVGVNCLYEPTAQRSPPLGSETLWRLVSLLTLNHQSLVDGSTGKEQLREILMLFASDSARDHQQIRGISELETRAITARVTQGGWRGYCRGTDVTLEFDEEAFVGGSPLLLAAVLARFFAMYTSVNSFARLGVRRGDETWKQWDPMSGRQLVL